MKTTGEAFGGQRKALFLTCMLSLLAMLARAQDVTITNPDQLAQVALSANYSIYLPFEPWDWRAFPTDWPLWCDFTQMGCLDSLPTSTNFMTSMDWSNVPLASVILTKNVLSGVTTVQSADSTDVVATIAAPGGYQPGVASEDRWLWNWYVQTTNNPDSWGLTAGQIPSPIVTLQTFLADSNAYYSVYESNLEAEAEAAAAAQASSTPTFAMGRGFMAMDEDDEESDPCTITNESAPFSVVSLTPDGSGDMILQWQSCTDHVYIVQSESSLTPTSSWTDVAWMFGTDQQTSWTDTNAVGLMQNFYQVARANPTNTNNGIPYGWAVTYGLDPLDPNLASETSTNPWAHGLTDLQVYENPSVLYANNYSSIGDGIPDWWRVMYFGVCTTVNISNCATCDPESDGLDNLTKFLLGNNPNMFDPPLNVIVNGGNAYTPSLTISIQNLSTNYPNLRISTDPLMSNATVAAFSSGIATYALADNGDGLYRLYLQYADAASHPHGVVMATSVTLDRLPPVVQINSPASNAVLNQAFITLQAVAADPNPVVPDGERPLSIWINGQPFWDRNGTNIVIERFPVPAGTNSLTVTIQAVDQAGNTNQATQTWAINTSTATNAPNLLSVNLTSSMTLPNVNSIWVEGTVDNDYALISVIVYAASGDVLTNSLSVSQNQYEGLVSLESGTNQLDLVASDAAGNATSNIYTIISTTEFSGAITNPVFGTFATAPSNYVSGYVSALYDAGLPTQTNVTTVTVNGVAAVLGTNVDAYGNVPFWTTNTIPLGVPIIATIGGPGIPTDPPTLQPAQSQVYEVIAKSTSYDLFPPGESYGASRPSAPCDWTWFVAIENEVISNEFDLSGGEDSVVFNVYQNMRFLPPPYYVCTGDPDNAASLLGAWIGFEYQDTITDTNPVRSLTFGSYPRGNGWCWYCAWPHGPSVPYEAFFPGGGEQYWPWENQQFGSITFIAPRQYGTNTTVIFTFEGMQYQTPAGASQDLSQVQFRGQSPIAYSNEAQTVSYLLTVTGGQQYTINQDSFTWPSFTTNYIQQFPYATDFYCDTLHNLSWTNFHNALPQIIGPSNLVSTVDAAGLSVTLTAQGYLSTSTYQWSTTSQNVQFVGPTTGQSVTVAPIQGRWTPAGAVEVVTLIATFDNEIITNTFNIIVQHPTYVVAMPTQPVEQLGNVQMNITYQILDQNSNTLRCTVPVGYTMVRIANLLASEQLAWQCGTSCAQVGSYPNGEAHDMPVHDDGTFRDQQNAPTYSSGCPGFVRSQVLLVGINTWPFQDIVFPYKCICFDGATTLRVLDGTADPTACCATCGF